MFRRGSTEEGDWSLPPVILQLGIGLLGFCFLAAVVLGYGEGQSQSAKSVAIVCSIPIGLFLLLSPQWAAAAYVFSAPFAMLSATGGGIGSIPMLVGVVFMGSLVINCIMGRVRLVLRRKHILLVGLWAGWLLLSTALNAEEVLAAPARRWGFKAVFLNVLAYVCLNSVFSSSKVWWRTVLGLACGTGALALYAPQVMTTTTGRGFEQAWMPNSHPEGMGFHCAMALLLGWPLAVLPRNPPVVRVATAVLFIPCVYSMAKTANQQTTVAAVVGGIATFLVLLLWSPRVTLEKSDGANQVRRALGPTKVLVGGAMALSAVLGLLAVTGTWDAVAAGVYYRFRNELTNPVSDDSGTGRVGLWKDGLRNAMNGPLYGSGVFTGNYLHNDILQVFADGGIVLLILSVVFVVSHIKAVLRLCPRRDGTVSLQQAVTRAAFTGGAANILFASCFGPCLHFKILWAFWALSVRLPQHMSDTEPAPSESTEEAPPGPLGAPPQANHAE